jgi:D-proline reductase (dithiol) PrdB
LKNEPAGGFSGRIIIISGMFDAQPRTSEKTMPVDSFNYLPRIIATFYQMTEREPDYPIPWTPVTRPLDECIFGLVTSGGLYHRGVQPPFDLERERDQPTWGDPSYRSIPVDINPSEVGVSHLHLNQKDIQTDYNILLPLDRFKELTDERVIGGVTDHAFAFMGYQGYPPETKLWERTVGPEVAEKLKAEGANCVLLTPA